MSVAVILSISKLPELPLVKRYLSKRQPYFYLISQKNNLSSKTPCTLTLLPHFEERENSKKIR